jgi:exopolysaccharide biosynthesis protein
VSVTVNTVVETIAGRKVTYYVADIYVASMENFKTYTAHDQMRYYITQNVEDMSVAANAIVGLSGDYFSSQKAGFIVRNSNVYLSDRSNAICVLFPDGTMETYEAGTYSVGDILSRDPLQVWSFGPVLLDAAGNVMPSYEVSSGLRNCHPRSAVGYFEPGHYCFVVVDGRQNHSYGIEIKDLAQLMKDLGCKAAYNLDGGASAVMTFDGSILTKPSNGGRDIADILLITDSQYYTGMGG